MYDLLIKGATVINGLSEGSKVLDVAVSSGLIVAVGPSIKKAAKKEINANGMILCPGFIDTQNHSDTSGKMLEDPQLPDLLKQGLSTVSLGHCGSSLCPFNSQEAYLSIAHWHGGEPLNIGWQNTGEYLSRLNEMRLGINVVTFVGLDNLIATGKNSQPEAIVELLTQELSYGACGLSVRISENFSNSDWEILRSCISRLAKLNSALSVHIDNSSKSYDQVEKLIKILQGVNLRAKISHLNSLCVNQDFSKILNLLEDSWHKGVKVYFDVYPEIFTQHRLKDLVLNTKKTLQNVNLEDKRRFKEQINNYNGAVGELLIARSKFSGSSVGKTIAEFASAMGSTSEDACLELLCQGGEDIFVFKRSATEEQIFSLISHPQAMLASNYSQTTSSGFIKRFLDHPRNTLSFPKFLAVAQQKNLDLPSLISKMTGRPAKFLGVKNRGVIETGKFADLVLIDPHRPFEDESNEKKFLEKIRYVIIAGTLVVENGTLLNLREGVAIAV